MAIYILLCLISLFIGFLIGKYFFKSDGLFIVDDRDYEKTMWKLDVNFDPKDLPNKKEVRLKVRKVTEEDV